MLFNNTPQSPTSPQTPQSNMHQQSPNSFQGQMYRRKSSPRLRVKIFGVLAAMLLIVGLPVVLFVSQNQQKSNTKASTPTNNTALQNAAFSCSNAPVDIMLIIDRSGSMSNTLGTTSTTKLKAAITAAQTFVTTLSQNTNNRVGLATFSTTSTLDSALTSDFNSVKTKIGSLTATGNTCTQCGITTANQEVAKDGRSGIKKVVVLLTDGIANTVPGNSNKVAASVAESGAITVVKSGYAANNTTFFTIGLGNKDGNTETGINETFLKQIATLTSGQYYYSPDSSQLNSIYQSISNIVGKGSISGFVYNDINKNVSFDTSDAPLASWTVNLKDSTNASVLATATTDATGAYTFTGVCDASYTVSEVTKTGWTQTSPTNPNYYSVTISGGDNHPDKNFGNIQAACGSPCTSSTQCSNNTTSGCTYCSPSTSTCTTQPSLTPTACVTPGQIQNVKVTCANCSTQ